MAFFFYHSRIVEPISTTFFFFLWRHQNKKRDFCAYFCFCSNTVCFRLLHIFCYKTICKLCFLNSLAVPKSSTCSTIREWYKKNAKYYIGETVSTRTFSFIFDSKYYAGDYYFIESLVISTKDKLREWEGRVRGRIR